MIEKLKNILGFGPSVDYAQLVKDGAIVLDVRSKAEFSSGHVKGSINIAVDTLDRNLHRLPGKEETIITVCASGMRSARARRFLLSKGYTSVYDAGSWFNLQHAV